MKHEIYPGDRWNHKRTGEQFTVDAIDDDEVLIRSDRRSVKISPAHLSNLYVLDENSDDAPAEPDDPATDADPIQIGTAEGTRAVGLISIGRLAMEVELPDPIDRPLSYFKKKKSNAGRKRLTDVPRYANGRIKRERYDFLTSNDTLNGKETKNK